MSPAIINSVIRGELKRIRKVGGQIDRRYLHRETGLKWYELEAAISRNAVEMISEEAAEQRIKRGD